MGAGGLAAALLLAGSLAGQRATSSPLPSELAGQRATTATTSSPAAPPEVVIESGPFRPRTVLQASVEAVPLAVVVRDAHGGIVGNLTRDDFEVLDRGVPQTLASFSVERHGAPEAAVAGGARPEASAAPTVAPAAGAATTAPAAAAAPLTVALFIDDLNSSFQYGTLAHTRDIALAFVRAGLAPNERVGLFTASGGHEVAFTHDADALEQAIAALKPVSRVAALCSERFRPGVYDDGNEFVPTETPGVEIPYEYYSYLAVVKSDRRAALRIAMLCFPDDMVSADEGRQYAQRYWTEIEGQSRGILAAEDGAVTLLGAQAGDRVLLLAGSGFVAETLHDAQAKLEADALHNRVVINALDTDGPALDVAVDGLDRGARPPQMYSGLADTTMRTSGMTELTAVTGGTFFRSAQDLGPGMQGLARFPETIYLMSFVPTRLADDGSFHTLRVRLRAARGDRIETRAGYNAPPAEANPSAVALTQSLNAAALGSAETAGIPATVKVTAQPRAGREPAHVKVTVAVDARALPWDEIDGRSVEALTFAAVLSRPNGSYATGERSTLTLRLRKTTRDHYEKTGIAADMSIPVLAGTYQLRLAVLESVQGKVSTFNRTVNVP